MTVVAAAAGDDGRRGMRLQTGRGRNGGIHAKKSKKRSKYGTWGATTDREQHFFSPSILNV